MPGHKAQGSGLDRFNYCEARAAGGYYCDAAESAWGNVVTGRHGLPLAVAAFALLAVSPAIAGSAWDDTRASAFGTRTIEDGSAIVAFHAPYRAEDQRAVPLSAEAAFKDGRKIKSITFIIDENPMPVAAAFRFADRRDRATLSIDIRLDHASPV